MKRLRYPSAAFEGYLASLPRGSAPRPQIEAAVARIVAAVRKDGDRALVRFSTRFDGVRLTPARLRVKPSEIAAVARRADPELVAALRRMAKRIETFHARQRGQGFRLRLADGSLLEELVRPLDSAGLYVPGGAGAYPSSVLMNAIPAQVAGVKRLAVVTPPRGLEASPGLCAALQIVGLENSVYRVGGAQAVAALAYGTATVPAVAKIVGPGNAYVAAAKRLVRGVVEIDNEAGPSEVVILADGTANAWEVAIDLLAQAEHGSGDETAVLVTTSATLADQVEWIVAEAVGRVSNVAATRRALRRHGAVVLVKNLDAGVEAVNRFAPEHAEVQTRRSATVARRIVAGAVFAGRYSPVAVGDYGIGPNHVLPTSGTARSASPLSVRDFERRQSLVTMTRAGLARVADDIARIAHAEGFAAHGISVLARSTS
jgi:histidinol dehydrogenase